jgi:hypothetical protein
MGLWLKCPKCQAQNPLSLKICPHCGRDLDKLPAAQRVYVMGPAAASPPAKSKPPAAVAASPSGTPSPQAGAAPKPDKKPKRTPKKKS